MTEETASFDENASNENDIIVQFFDLHDPLSRFKILLEQLWRVSLSDYSIWLQDSTQLDEDKSLIQHGVEGEGKVQIKLQIKMTRDGSKMINIIDVLKPTDELADPDTVQDADESLSQDAQEDLVPNEKCVQWVESREFVVEKLRHGIPSDPQEWNNEDVKKWLNWAIKTFELDNIDVDEWAMNGAQVCSMTMEAFKKKVPRDPNGHFWTHLQVLQKCGQVAVCLDQEKHDKSRDVNRLSSSGKVTNTNVNLWSFLLELLTKKEYRDVIRWVNDEGEFHIVRPDSVARLWGEKKQKANMTYEKLTRALRYYYEGDMISKVSGRRFVYKFHCDVKEIVGYSPMELDAIFTES
ncbi:DNA-binding protein Ets97D [Planococcus citri]|uniref:DNA-binding protein Ets97D n=1 Tax=Planococcus citri TaxID=170843 RepID=UPI0031F72565